ncbi:hypothetical protein ACWF50_10830 [Brucella pseudogrignonensis]
MTNIIANPHQGFDLRVKREKAAEPFRDVKMRAKLFADMKISLLNSAIERKALSFKGLCLLIIC